MFAWRDSSRRGLARRRRRASRRRRALALARVLARVASSSRAPRIASSRVVARAKCGARARRRRANKSRTLRHPGRFSLENHARDKSRVSRALDARTRGGDRASCIRLLATRDRPSTPWGCVSRRSTLDAMRSTRARRDARGSRVARATRDDDDDANASLGL